MEVIKYPSDTVGRDVKREDLEVIKIHDEKWVVAKKTGYKPPWWEKDEEDTTDYSLLCIGWHCYDSVIYEPISWSTHAEAQKWIDEGCIADIQESIMCLDVGFRKELIVRRY